MSRNTNRIIYITSNFKIRRGDVIYADLGDEEDVVGSEQFGIRPVLITQCNRNNNKSTTYIAVILTSSIKRLSDPCHVLLPRMQGLPKITMACCEQRFTLDRERFIKFVGHVGGQTIKKITRACHKAEEADKKKQGGA